MAASRMEVKTLLGSFELRLPAYPGEKSAISIFLAEPILERPLRQAIENNPLALRALLPPGQLTRMPTASAVLEIMSGLRYGRMVLVAPGDGGEGDDPANRAWAAYDAFRDAFGREFSVAMRTHRLVSRERVADVRREADYDVVPAAEAAEFVLRLAKTRGGGALQAKVEVLSKNMVDLRGPAGGHGFVLLRAPLAQAARYVPPEEVITPAKLKKMVEEKEKAEKISPFDITEFRAPKNFAPGVEEIAIEYAFSDPDKVGDSAKLELFIEGQSDPIWAKPIPIDHMHDEKGKLSWRGEVDSAKFPDGHITIEHDKYILKLTALGAGKTPMRELPIQVLVDRIEVHLAPLEALKEERDRAVCQQIGALPARKGLNLEGNVFALRFPGSDGTTELQEGADTGWSAYRSLWDGGKGPRIPLVSTVYIKDSKGKGVVAGKAYGAARVLWDYEEVPASVPGVDGLNRSYLDKVEKYRAEQSRANSSYNVHVFLGGKRPDKQFRENLVLTENDGKVENFPFASESGRNRYWAAFAALEKSGDHEGKAGIVFRPSIVAGDHYKISAHLDARKALDVEGAVPEVPHAHVGDFAIWREVTLAKRFRKTSTLGNEPVDVSPYFRSSYVNVRNNLADNTETLTKAQYDALFNGARARLATSVQREILWKYAIPNKSQYDYREQGFFSWLFGEDTSPTTIVSHLREYDDFVEEYVKGEPGSKNSNIRTLGEWELGNEAQYIKSANDLLLSLAIEMTSLLSAPDGLMVLQFTGVHNLESMTRGRTLGVAAFDKSERHKSAFVQFDNSASTFAHEMGHCLFMPHASSAPHIDIDGVKIDRHVGGLTDCLMAYGRTRGFCAVCQLRLRGANGGRFTRFGPDLPPAPAAPPPPPLPAAPVPILD